MLVQKEKPEQKGPTKQAKPPVKAEVKDEDTGLDREPQRRARQELSRSERRQTSDKGSKQGKEEQKTKRQEKDRFQE